MRLLIDTHLLVWTAQHSRNLSRVAIRFIQDPENHLIFSVASIWEYGIKYAKAPDQFATSPHEFRDALLQNGYSELSISGAHVLAVSNLPRLHADPFDRILIAQSMVEGFTLLTSDVRMAQYPGPIRKV